MIGNLFMLLIKIIIMFNMFCLANFVIDKNTVGIMVSILFTFILTYVHKEVEQW